MTDTNSLVHDELFRSLQPLPRSLTGGGVRETLRLLKEAFVSDPRTARATFDVVEVPTGSQVLDWQVPEEWNVRGAYLADTTGRRIVDLDNNGLHLVGYSEPFSGRLSFEELEPHLHTMADRPGLVPYRTSYYKRQWGFCVTGAQMADLKQAQTIDVCVDTTLGPGSLTYGEIRIPGTTGQSLIVSTHICHPWMVNDNVSGMVAVLEVAAQLAALQLSHEIVCLFSPGTIGAITWLAQSEQSVARIRGGVVLTGLGDPVPLTYKRSRRGDRLFDRTFVDAVLRHDDQGRIRPWDPYGYDERQFCSPGFDLPVGRLTRGVHGEFPEYHTSADSLDFCDLSRVRQAVEVVVDGLVSFDSCDAPRLKSGLGEPQLGRRGLYNQVGGAINGASPEMSYLWALSLADGDHTVEDIATSSGQPLEAVQEAVRRLRAADLLVPASF